ncbi:MAG: hypothetical protein ACKVQB_03350 [Bacteroidia bacterium]
MKPAKSILYLLLFFPIFTIAQFGPKKKDLQLQIDTLKMQMDFNRFELDYFKMRDSVASADLKRLSHEFKDLKKYTLDINTNIEKLRLENEGFEKDNQKLKKLYDDLLKKVEIHQILIRNVIGGDSLELFEKQIQEENNPKSSIESSANFATFAGEFISTIKKDGEAGLISYLRKSKSFYYLSKPGFITSVAEIKDVSELTEEIPWRAGFDAFKKSKFTLLEGEKPQINCDMADFYNKRGCYGGIEQDFDKVSKALIALKEFSPDEDLKLNSQITEIKISEASVVAFIYSTDGNLGFYFIKIEGTWQLYCLEIEDPCSA